MDKLHDIKENSYFTKSRTWNVTYSLWRHESEVKELREYMKNYSHVLPKDMVDAFNEHVQKLFESSQNRKRYLEELNDE